MNGEEWEYLLSSVASWSAPLLGEVGRVINGTDCLLPAKVGSVLTNSPALWKLWNVLQYFLPSHSHLDPCSLGSHSVCMSQVFWRITKNTAVITCHLMCMGLMSIAKSTKIFLFSVQTLVILYLSITLRFPLFCLLLLQDSYSPFSIQKETQI